MMNKDQLAGKWQQLKGEVRKQWGKLTDDELDQINGSRTKLGGYIREHYGLSKEKVEDEIDQFCKRHERADA